MRSLVLACCSIVSLCACDGAVTMADAALDGAATRDALTDAATTDASSRDALMPDARAPDVFAPDATAPDADIPDASARLQTGTIVPLYTYPTDPSWARLAAAARAHRTVTFVAIINPNSGPTTMADPAYVSGTAALAAAGITVIGYVATGYATRAATLVNADVDRYRAQYPALSGIFFDEAAVYEAGHEALYQSEVSYARSIGYRFFVANPGTAPLAAYLPLFDATLVYETAGLPAEPSLRAWDSARGQCGIIPYGVASLDVAAVRALRTHVQYIFVTDDALPNPWDTLPPYFDALVTALE